MFDRYIYNYEFPRHLEVLLHGIDRKLDLLIERMNDMATKEQLDKLRVDVANLIDKAVKVITEAVAELQTAPPEQADPAIDALDTTVTGATQTLTDLASKLRNPPA